MGYKKLQQLICSMDEIKKYQNRINNFKIIRFRFIQFRALN